MEVGAAGQARLAAARVRTVEGPAGRIEARYLRGAGLSVEGGLAAPSEGAAAWATALRPGASEVAAGALAALSVVRAVLDGRAHPRVSATPRSAGG